LSLNQLGTKNAGQVKASAKEKKLAGAANTSYMKKCVADAVGSK